MSFLSIGGSSNSDKAISELTIIDELIKRNEQGILMMIGISLANILIHLYQVLTNCCV
jgi:hypothetical protein